MRDVSSLNAAQATATSLHEVVLVHLAFDEPVFAHSGLGLLLNQYDGNTYLGVGSLGGLGETKESELLSAFQTRLQLSGVDAAALAEALETGNFGDRVTMYLAFKGADGELVDEPHSFFTGRFEYSAIKRGGENVIEVFIQHDLADVGESDGSRNSDEDQKQTYPADEGFEFVHENESIKLLWGGRRINAGVRIDIRDDRELP